MCNSSLGLGTDFLDMTPKVQIKEENTDQIFSKLKKIFFCLNTVRKMKKSKEWEKYFL